MTAEFNEGDSLVFEVTRGFDPSDPAFRRAIANLGNLGIQPQFQTGIVPTTPPTFEGLAEQNPITSEMDFMGKEHFRFFGNLVGLTPRLSGIIYGTIVDPFESSVEGIVRRRRVSVIGRYYNIVDKDDFSTRFHEGLPEIPEPLSNAQTRKRDFRVIRARALIAIAKEEKTYASVEGAGKDCQAGLKAIAQLVSKTIDSRQ